MFLYQKAVLSKGPGPIGKERPTKAKIKPKNREKVS